MKHLLALLAPALALGLVACTSTGQTPRGSATGADGLPLPVGAEEFIDVRPALDPGSASAIGAFLTETSNRIQGWSNAELQGDVERARLLESVLAFDCTRRQDELVEQLENGPPRNRAIAAVALGFTNRHVRIDPDGAAIEVDKGARALSPLLAAALDADPEVAANALMGLGILGRPETPFGPICQRLTEDPDDAVRSNAAYALSMLADRIDRSELGLDDERAALAASACLRGLSDPDIGVRAQCAAVLGLVGGEDVLDHLGDRLDDDSAFVAEAATISLARLGRGAARLKPRSARILATALDRVRPTYREVVLYGLVLLSGSNLGEDSEPWLQWSARLGG